MRMYEVEISVQFRKDGINKEMILDHRKFIMDDEERNDFNIMFEHDPGNEYLLKVRSQQII